MRRGEMRGAGEEMDEMRGGGEGERRGGGEKEEDKRRGGGEEDDEILGGGENVSGDVDERWADAAEEEDNEDVWDQSIILS